MTKEELRKIKEIYARNHFLGISAEALILEVERLQSEIERLQSEREWRPIETVPDEVKKDGTPVLVVHRGGTFWAEYADIKALIEKDSKEEPNA